MPEAIANIIYEVESGIAFVPPRKLSQTGDRFCVTSQTVTNWRSPSKLPGNNRMYSHTTPYHMQTSGLKSRIVDLAGDRYQRPRYFQTRRRINCLVNRYLSTEILDDRLQDLAAQFQQPHQRPWEPIYWQQIHLSQIIDVEPSLFLAVIASAAEIETPIREYAQESWGYLRSAHPPIARFMGGVTREDGSIVEVGVWEKEERQHAPAFRKIYQQLTGEKIKIKPNTVGGYQASDNLRADIYKHAISRISTEWSASAVYLWLMAHSTGALQQAIAQPLQDEVNHLAKMWGISYWAFGDSYLRRFQKSFWSLTALLKHHQGERTESQDILQLSYAVHSIEIGFTLLRIMVQLNRWHRTLKRRDLEALFGRLEKSKLSVS